jgi:hypothetical protein
VATVALPLTLPVAAGSSPTPQGGTVQPAAGGWENGLIGFITSDGLFFVEVGAPDFIGGFLPYFNGSQIYTYQIILNITSLSQYQETATIHLVDADSHQSIANVSVPMSGYSNQMVPVTLPTEHAWTDLRITVDGTSGLFQWETPYTLFSLGNLFNGGIDLSVFAGFGIYLWVAYLLAVKAERMTKRAVYAPEWKATWWLHGIVVGEIAAYAIWFEQINSYFKGAEVLLIPFPIALFGFFWTAGRHSRKVVLEFKQPVTIIGRPMSYIRRRFYGGIDPEGNIVLIKYNSRSVFQWWYRSRGFHVKVWSLFDDGRPATRLTTAQARKPKPLEPLVMPVYDYEALTPEQLRDPALLPRSGIYDQFRGAAIQGEGGNEDETVGFEFMVVRISDFRVTWPYLSFWKAQPAVSYKDTETGLQYDEPAKEKLTWPHIVPGSAEVTLMSTVAGQDVLAEHYGYVSAEDNAATKDDLAVALEAANAHLNREANRMAAERTLANRFVLDFPNRELEEPESEALVDQSKADRDKRRPSPSGSG